MLYLQRVIRVPDKVRGITINTIKMVKIILNVFRATLYSSCENIRGNYSHGRQDQTNVWWKDN